MSFPQRAIHQTGSSVQGLIGTVRALRLQPLSAGDTGPGFSLKVEIE